MPDFRDIIWEMSKEDWHGDNWILQVRRKKVSSILLKELLSQLIEFNSLFQSLNLGHIN